MRLPVTTSDPLRGVRGPRRPPFSLLKFAKSDTLVSAGAKLFRARKAALDHVAAEPNPGSGPLVVALGPAFPGAPEIIAGLPVDASDHAALLDPPTERVLAGGSQLSDHRFKLIRVPIGDHQQRRQGDGHIALPAIAVEGTAEPNDQPLLSRQRIGPRKPTREVHRHLHSPLTASKPPEIKATREKIRGARFPIVDGSGRHGRLFLFPMGARAHV